MFLTNHSDPLNLYTVIDSVKQSTQSLQLNNSAKKELMYWTSWIEKKRKLFLINKISKRQYLESSCAYANYLHKNLELNSPEITNLIERRICPTCLSLLQQPDIKLKMCSNCRMPLPITFKYDSELPPKPSFFSSLTLFWQVLLFPNKTFKKIKYNYMNWFHFIGIFLFSNILLALIVYSIAPKFYYSDYTQNAGWINQKSIIFIRITAIYILLNIFMILLYSFFLYIMTRGSYVHFKKKEIIQLASLILIPKMIFFPLYVLLYQLTTESTFWVSTYTSFEDASWLLLNISDYSGSLILPFEALMNLWVLILIVYALVNIWNYDIEEALKNVFFLGWIITILVFGVALYL